MMINVTKHQVKTVMKSGTEEDKKHILKRYVTSIWYREIRKHKLKYNAYIAKTTKVNLGILSPSELDIFLNSSQSECDEFDKVEETIVKKYKTILAEIEAIRSVDAIKLLKDWRLL